MSLTVERAKMWRGDPAEFVLISSDPRRVIARAYEQCDADELAARYNACEGVNPEAVPELLAACKATISDKETVITIPIYDQLLAAVAKAEKVKGEV